MSTIVWFLVISGVSHDSGIAVIPVAYASQEDCIKSGKESVDPNGWKRAFVCVPAPSKGE